MHSIRQFMDLFETAMGDGRSATITESVVPPKPVMDNMADAIDHADIYGDAGWSMDDFRTEYVGYLTVRELSQFDDIDSWIEVSGQDDLDGFRQGEWNQSPDIEFPPVIVITAPDPDGGCMTQIGDGRGRVNFANAHGLRVHVYHMIHQNCGDE